MPKEDHTEEQIVATGRKVRAHRCRPLGCVGILVHSFLDFNLQVPANAAMFYVLCAVAASNPLQESQRRRSRRNHYLIVEPPPGPVTS